MYYLSPPSYLSTTLFIDNYQVEWTESTQNEVLINSNFSSCSVTPLVTFYKYFYKERRKMVLKFEGIMVSMNSRK